MKSYNLELEEEIEDVRQELKHSREQLRGLETPSQFEVPDQVLDKLTILLEKARRASMLTCERVPKDRSAFEDA